MQFACFQHVAAETPGLIQDWTDQRNHILEVIRFDQPEPRSAGNADALIILGGPMSIHDEIVFPWLSLEKQWIKEAILQNKKVLGICLGAQLLASVQGASVYANPEAEIGFMPIRWSNAAKRSPLFRDFPDRQTVFHWHGETFDLPVGSQWLASSEACKNQAFQMGKNLLGLQFHLEVNALIVEKMCQDYAWDLQEADFVQSAERIRDNLDKVEGIRPFLFSLLDRFFG
jgi:GMP synthase-like glutamine amidotransferase